MAFSKVPSDARSSMDAASRSGMLPDAIGRSNKRPLTSHQLTSMRPAKVFQDAVQNTPKNHITSLSFDDDGHYCITSGEDEVLTFWNCLTGKKHKFHYAHKYGVDNVATTHIQGNTLHTSTKVNHDIRYHSSQKNEFIRYFKGHEAKVNSLSVNPINDNFLSGGDDGTVLMWDIRAQNARGKLKELGDSTIVAWDSTGSCFAVGVVSESAIALYASNSFDSEPFCYSHIVDPELAKITSPPRRIQMTSLAFSNNGKYILVGTSGDTHYVLEAFSLAVVARLVGHVGLERDREGKFSAKPRKGMSGHEVSFTPDSQFVFSGSHNGEILIWDLKPPPETGLRELTPVFQQDGPDMPPRTAARALQPIARLNQGNEKGGPSRVVGFNPRHCMFVSGGHEVVMWLPEKAVKEDDEDEDMELDS